MERGTPDFGDFGVTYPRMQPKSRGTPDPNMRYTTTAESQVFLYPRLRPGNDDFFTLGRDLVASAFWPPTGGWTPWGRHSIAGVRSQATAEGWWGNGVAGLGDVPPPGSRDIPPHDHRTSLRASRAVWWLTRPTASRSNSIRVQDRQPVGEDELTATAQAAILGDGTHPGVASMRRRRRWSLLEQ